MGETALEYKKRVEAGMAGETAGSDSSKSAVLGKMDSTDLGAAGRENTKRAAERPKTMEITEPVRKEGESALVYAGRVSRWKKAQQAGQARALEKK